MKKLIAMMLMIASVFFIACEDNTSKDPLTADQAKAELSNLRTDLSGAITNMQNTDGINVIAMLSSLPDPFAAKNKAMENNDVVSNITKYLLPTTILGKNKTSAKAPNFDFEYWWGTYTWDAEHSMWVVAFDDPNDDTDNMIVINFPSSETATTNDAKLTISDYAEVEIEEYDSITQTYIYYNNPSVISASLELNSVEIVSLDMNATWVTSGAAAGDPTDLNVDVYLIPFDFHVDFNHLNTTAGVNAWIKYNDSKIFSVGLNATFTNNSLDGDPTLISGSIQLYKVKFSADVKLADLKTVINNASTYSSVDALENDINKNIAADVTVDGAKAADIVIDFTTTQTPIIVDETNMIYLDVLFVYNDGSSESAIPYFLSFGTQLDEFFKTLSSYYGG